jgi:hypothetical protein
MKPETSGPISCCSWSRVTRRRSRTRSAPLTHRPRTGRRVSLFHRSGVPTLDRTGERYLAVQESITVTSVDWWLSHAWTVGDPDFTGQITVVVEPISRPVADLNLGRSDRSAGRPDPDLDRLATHRTLSHRPVRAADRPGHPGPAVVPARHLTIPRLPAARNQVGHPGPVSRSRCFTRRPNSGLPLVGYRCRRARRRTDGG